MDFYPCSGYSGYSGYCSAVSGISGGYSPPPPPPPPAFSGAGPSVGQVDLTVRFLTSKSPFQGQRQQDAEYYFRRENYKMLTDRINIFPLWEPLNGIRCEEKIDGYNNYLKDAKGNRLEESKYKQVITIEESGKDTEIKATVEYDPSAVARAADLYARQKEQNPKATDAELEAERDYFTWDLSEDTLVKTIPPRNFDEPEQIDNAPEWSYGILQRPGAGKGVLMLVPFMKKNPPNRESPVHWALLKSNAIALNQPFELTYYFHGRESVVVDTQKDFVQKYNFLNQDMKPIPDYKLYSSVYLAFEIGIQKKFLFVFASDKLPACFQIDKDKNAILVGAFEGFNPQKIFDPNNKYFNISIEPIAGSLVLKSNQFFDAPWILISSMVNPFIIEESPIMVYGSNINASFTFRPLTYQNTGSFSTTPRMFRVKNYVQPTLSCALKGNGDIEQNRSYNKNTNKESDGGKVYMIDAETLKQDEETKDIKTIIEYQAGDKVYVPQKLNRNVSLKLVETDEEGKDLEKRKPSSGSDSRDEARFYKAKVELTSSDVAQPSGYVVKNGKSPIIWMLRITAPNDSKSPSEEAIDITCDVMSIDLSWNAASYNEILQTGTLKVLNKPNKSKRDYKQYQNRTIYLTIDAGWKPCDHPSSVKQRIFTGITTNTDVTQTAGVEIVVFKIEDYMHVLNAMKFRLSPTYDAMKLSLAVADIVKMTGLGEDRIYFDDKPMREANISNDYVLPFLNPFDEPKFKFSDGTALKEAILKFAKIDFRSILFDTYGNFHIATIPGGPLGDAKYTITEKFTTSDTKVPFNMVWNQYKFSRTTKDVYNGISVVTVDKRDPSIVYVVQDVYRAGMEDPNAEGYLGFEKPLILREAALGSYDAAQKYLDTYKRRLFIPPLTNSIEVYGRPTIVPLKIISINDQPVRILNINTRINAQENMYWQSMEGEWMFYVAKDQSPAITPKDGGNTPTKGDGASKASTA